MQSTPYRLFLDDLRDPPDATWVVARSFEEAVNIIAISGCPELISFDHDLGPGRTGYDFAHWLVQQDLDRKILQPEFSFQVHSANPVGARNITCLLDRYLTFRRDP